MLSSISPESVEVGSSARRISLKGQHFVKGVVVRVNTLERRASIESDTELSVDLQKEDFTERGRARYLRLFPAARGRRLQHPEARGDIEGQAT